MYNVVLDLDGNSSAKGGDLGILHSSIYIRPTHFLPRKKLFSNNFPSCVGQNDELFMIYFVTLNFEIIKTKCI